MSLDVMEAFEKRMKEEVENKTRIIEVTEVMIEDDTLKIMVTPCNSNDFQKIMAAEEGVERAITTMVCRAKKEDGKNMFAPAERESLKKILGPILLLQIAGKINEDLKIIKDDETVRVLGKS